MKLFNKSDKKRNKRRLRYGTLSTVLTAVIVVCFIMLNLVADSLADRYPLSLKDSCLATAVPEMAEMGISCLKLEGRMKRPEYVALITDIYARLLRENRKATKEEMKTLEEIFSRDGFTQEYWEGRKGPKMFGVRSENTPEPKELYAKAKALYEKLGFTQVGLRKNYYRNPREDACILRKEWEI